MKHYIFVANWKMYPCFTDMVAWCDRCASEDPAWFGSADIVVCPESTYFPFIYTALSPAIHIGAQDCSLHTSGAFTGEVSVAHLAEVDVFYTIVGHHERRSYHQETSEIVTQKSVIALSHGVTPIVCVPDASDAEQVFAGIKKSEVQPKVLICAYEPPAAIGTGQIADFMQIEKVCLEIRSVIEGLFPESEVLVLYGGSVTPEHAEGLRAIGHINGLLVGKASTDFQAFKNIVSFFMNKAL